MFGYYPTFHTLTSVGRKSTFQYAENMFPLFFAILKIILCYCCMLHQCYNSLFDRFGEHCDWLLIQDCTIKVSQDNMP